MLLASSTSLAAERAIEVELRPAGDPQIAIWLEDANGNFRDTLMVTKLVGTFGLGNRPGQGNVGGSYLWPYGKRDMVLPIWAHKRNKEYDRVVFQDCRENSLGWHESTSSTEPFYCRPLTPAEMSVDTITCPTTQFNTDKGIPVKDVVVGSKPDCTAEFKAGVPTKSLYPPRNDIVNADRIRDYNGVGGPKDFAAINDLDAVSRATPAEGQVFKLTWKMPDVMAPGDYVVWIEVNQEYDSNSTYDFDFDIDPMLRDYGVKWRGQPSIVWKVPITIGEGTTVAQVKDYAGYGSPDGRDGNVRPPDNTITTNVAGSGAQRLLTMSNAAGEHRVKVVFNPEAPCVMPEPVGSLSVMGADYNYIDIGFVTVEDAAMFETRYAEGTNTIVTDDDFMRAIPGPNVVPGQPGMMQTFRMELPRPKQKYTIAVRAHDRCNQASAISALPVETPDRIFATVDACFIATAAYGSKDQADVVELRSFRDRVLMKTELGQSFVDTYYAVSPPIADLVREHDSLRFIVRSMLGPVVSAVRDVE